MKTLVLLHGWGTSGRVWHRQVEAFGGRLPVLTPTLPTWKAAWVADYLNRLPLQDCLVVGWSLGGILLLEALPYLGTPLAGLVLVAVSPAFCRKPGYRLGQQTAVVRAMRQALREDFAGVLKEFAHRCLGPEEEAYQEEVTALFGSEVTPDHLVQGLDYLLRQDLRSQLHHLPGRPVIVQGDQDCVVPVAQAHYLQEHLNGARLYILHGAGHVPFLTQAPAFNGILEKLMKGQVPGT